jgi:hypothetical protein
VTNTLKEARLQKSVLTNRNDIRGIEKRVSMHINTKPKVGKLTPTHQRGDFLYVDVAAIDGRKMLLPKEVFVATG